MSVDARLVFRGTRREIESLYRALHPDNAEAPGYMVITEAVGENEYVLTVSVPLSPKRVRGLRQTLDEVLAIASMIEKTIKEGPGTLK